MPDSADDRDEQQSDRTPANSLPRGRFPAVAVAIALAVGISLDRHFVPAAMQLWWAAAVAIVACLSAAALKQRRVAMLLVLLLVTLAGALNHHRLWFQQSDDDIERLLSAERQLLKVRGYTSGFATIIVRDANSPGRTIPPLTIVILDVSATSTGDGWQPASGCLRIRVPQKIEVAPGDGVEVTGFVKPLEGPRNPGEQDKRVFQWSQQIRGELEAKSPDLFVVLPDQRSSLGAARLWLRTKCDAALREHLSGDSLGIALAFLIGDRSLLTPRVKNAFIETGTMHILAISGVHVTILAAFIVGMCRVFGLCNRSATFVMVLVAMMYLAIADVRPPMVRAFLIVIMTGGSTLLKRPGFPLNSLAVAAIAILVWNPSDLIDVGTQLSFLCVATIIWWSRQYPERRSDAEPEILSSWWTRKARSALGSLRSLFLLSAFIWVVTAPLTVATFHVFSPISPFVNITLAPLATPALWVGFLFLLVAMAASSLATPLGWLFDFLLKAMLCCVEQAADIPYGHVYSAAPPGWWLLVCYLLLAVAMLAAMYRWHSRVIVAGTALWLMLGVPLVLHHETTGDLHLTVLSVGHGLSVVIETPSGHLLVYDSGCMGTEETARRALAEMLWERHHAKIDTVVISHADIDHFNALPAILDQFRVQRLLFGPQFQNSREPAARLVHESIIGLPTQVVLAGDTIQVDPEIKLSVRHPQTEQPLENDNAASVVLELTCRGRRFLLTGDLEGSGLRELLKSPIEPLDMLLAPHHGSLKDNPAELVRWARPKWAVVSSDRKASIDRLQERYGSQTTVVGTGTVGAVEFRVSAQGHLTCKTHGTYKPAEDADFEAN